MFVVCLFACLLLVCLFVVCLFVALFVCCLLFNGPVGTVPVGPRRQEPTKTGPRSADLIRVCIMKLVHDYSYLSSTKHDRLDKKTAEAHISYEGVHAAAARSDPEGEDQASDEESKRSSREDQAREEESREGKVRSPVPVRKPRSRSRSCVGATKQRQASADTRHGRQATDQARV